MLQVRVDENLEGFPECKFLVRSKYTIVNSIVYPKELAQKQEKRGF